MPAHSALRSWRSAAICRGRCAGQKQTSARKGKSIDQKQSHGRPVDLVHPKRSVEASGRL